MNTVKVGIIGCGWFGNFHLDNLLKIEGAEVVALTSRSEEKLKATGKKVPGARLYKDYRDMYDSEKYLDAVVICVTPDAHEDVEIIAAKKGIHIYVEKPITLSMDKAYEIEEAIKKSGIICSVGYQDRYNEVSQKVKEYVSVNKVGIAIGRWIGSMPGALWWREKEKSGGQVVEQSTHIFDLLRYFFGEVNTVYSAAIKGLIDDVPDYDIEDASSTTITFKNGIVATVLTACYMSDIDKFDGVGLQICCNDSVVEYDWGKEVRYIKKDGIETVPVNASSHMKAVEAFIDAVKTGDSTAIKSTYSDAVKTLELTLAANKSMISGMPVKL